MAGPDSASAPPGRPAGGLRLGSVHLADGSQLDTDLRPALARSEVLRGDHSRQPRSGAAGPGTTDFRPGGDEENAGAIPYACNSGRGASQSAYQLQELRSEAVLQGGSRLPDGRDVSKPQ